MLGPTLSNYAACWLGHQTHHHHAPPALLHLQVLITAPQKVVNPTNFIGIFLEAESLELASFSTPFSFGFFCFPILLSCCTNQLPLLYHNRLTEWFQLTQKTSYEFVSVTSVWSTLINLRRCLTTYLDTMLDKMNAFFLWFFLVGLSQEKNCTSISAPTAIPYSSTVWNMGMLLDDALVVVASSLVWVDWSADTLTSANPLLK